jgi:hypothetical protein
MVSTCNHEVDLRSLIVIGAVGGDCRAAIHTGVRSRIDQWLESANGSIPVYVIDRVERPSEN